MACSAPPATRGAGGTESWSRDLDQARRGVGRVGARCARGRHRWRAGWLAPDDGGVATRSRLAPLSEGGPSSCRRRGARCARRRPDHRAPFAREGPPSGKRPRRGSRDDGRGEPSTQRHRSQAPRRGGRLGARCERREARAACISLERAGDSVVRGLRLRARGPSPGPLLPGRRCRGRAAHGLSPPLGTGIPSISSALIRKRRISAS